MENRNKADKNEPKEQDGQKDETTDEEEKKEEYEVGKQKKLKGRN